MASVTVTEEEVEELAHKLKRLGLSEGERAFLHAICDLATRALEPEARSDEVGGFAFESPSPVFVQGSQPNEFVIEKAKGGTKPTRSNPYLVFKFQVVFTT